MGENRGSCDLGRVFISTDKRVQGEDENENVAGESVQREGEEDEEETDRDPENEKDITGEEDGRTRRRRRDVLDEGEEGVRVRRREMQGEETTIMGDLGDREDALMAVDDM